ncbi:conserved hypothetical protein [Leishmania mexicana MHOM/GT/2001/U1103]|uniref:Protein-serine/threonine kinase n=1 Tax=Leishmania mexicana (strain MHOM/GT/2001/U1103) TaxID=929439 RepID=E9B5I3_LEIMU|nr:conserved hypothetical protein [Leishmania mexicana MHOM/GT/2001/U1103]CBZ30503.1 conserved hypothetical protein [Leishmania mexicana MHOM/GT/2001/U1103]
MQNFAMSFSRRPHSHSTALQRYLALPQTPLDLPALSKLQAESVDNGVVHQIVREMAIRTSRCYHSFSDSIIQKRMRKPHVDRLWWVKSYVLREFNYCVALHRCLEQCPQHGIFDNSTDITFERHEYGSSPFLFPCLRKTDDDSFIYEPAQTYSSSDSVSSHAPRDAENGTVSAGASSSTSTSATSTFRPLGFLSNPAMTRDEVEAAFSTWDRGKATMPLILALKVLRPRLSLLDVMVNEAAICSDELNGWFIRFCRRRVAWRVLHEHLLHLTHPTDTQQVISSDIDVAEVLQRAGIAVVEIFSSLVDNGSVLSLEIHLEEDKRILTRVPCGTLVSSSTSPLSCPADLPETRPTHVSSRGVYSVEGHLTYIFREVLKNACAATLKLRPDIDVLIRYASDDVWVVVEFVDQAGGIHPQHFKNIWKFGWTTSEHYESHLGGFGVGLPTSKVYMGMWGGSIDVYSTLGVETTVRVRFPKAPVEVLVPESTTPT